MSLDTVMKNVIKSIYEEFPKKWAATFLLKLEILFKFRMFSRSRSYSFAPQKAKEHWPVDDLHLGRFNCDMFLVLPLDTLNLSWNKLQSMVVPDLSYAFEP